MTEKSKEQEIKESIALKIENISYFTTHAGSKVRKTSIPLDEVLELVLSND